MITNVRMIGYTIREVLSGFAAAIALGITSDTNTMIMIMIIIATNTLNCILIAKSVTSTGNMILLIFL